MKLTLQQSAGLIRATEHLLEPEKQAAPEVLTALSNAVTNADKLTRSQQAKRLGILAISSGGMAAHSAWKAHKANEVLPDGRTVGQRDAAEMPEGTAVQRAMKKMNVRLADLAAKNPKAAIAVSAATSGTVGALMGANATRQAVDIIHARRAYGVS